MDEVDEDSRGGGLEGREQLHMKKLYQEDNVYRDGI